MENLLPQTWDVDCESEGGGVINLPPRIDIVEIWKNGEGALSVQARITDDGGTIDLAKLSVVGGGGQIGQALSPFPESEYGSNMYAGTIVNIPSADVVQFEIMARDPAGKTAYAYGR